MPISAGDFENVAENNGALILDTRNDSDFYKSFIPNSINIGLGGSFAPWVVL
jgi:rhodanese-related sulfurtransferase